MKKIVICNISMKKKLDKCVYASNDKALPASDRAVSFPICSYFDNALKAGDDLKVIMLVKKDGKYSHNEKNIEIFKEELTEAIGGRDISVEYKMIDTDFVETSSVHEELMSRLVDEIDVESEIYADITYGPKDLPLIVFSALTFAQKRLACEIEHIIYGLTHFDEKGKTNDSQLCDMVALFYLTSVVSSAPGGNPQDAKRMLKSMLFI